MPEHQASMADRFEAAAAALDADAALGAASPGARELLGYFGYDDGDAAAAASRARLLRVAAQFRRMFQIPVPDAPGLVFFGGEADPAVLGRRGAGLPLGSLAGSGPSPRRAFESCIGEGVEYLSQFVQESDRLRRGPAAEHAQCGDRHARKFIADVLDHCGVDTARPIAWIETSRLSDGAKAWFPADLCLRRPAAEQDFTPPLKLSTGCAAGPSFAAAALRAALELIERDAAALWWRGGRRGAAIAPESPAGQAAAALLAQLRQGGNERRCWLLDITTDVGIPAVAAISAGDDGYGFAYGFGARLSLAEAAGAAIFELCQVELSQHVIAAKRAEDGEEALNDSDRRQLRRATLFDTRSCVLLQPRAAAAPAMPLDPPADPAQGLKLVRQRLSALGITLFTLDLTRPELGVPVVRVLAPGLQLEPCQVVSARLAGAISETGGGALHTGGMPLL